MNGYGGQNMRLLTIITGVLLVLTGIWGIANQGVAFSALAFVLGVVMVIKGVVGILSFFTMKKGWEGMGWNLSESMFATVLGCVVLANQLATDLMISMFFGMWVLVAGCNRLVAGIVFKRFNNPAWNWTLGLGAVSVVVGVYTFLNPVLAGLVVGLIVGIIFMVQGVNTIAVGISMPYEKKHKYRKLIEKKEGRK